MIRVCFVSLYAYPLFDSHSRRPFGGSEVRGKLFAEGLKQTDRYDVSVVTFDHGRSALRERNAIKLVPHSFYKSNRARLLPYLSLQPYFPYIKLKRLSPGLLQTVPILLDIIRVKAWQWVKRLKTPPATIGRYVVEDDKIRVYQEVDADVYCIIGVSNVSAELALFCQQHRKKFLLIVGSDEDLSETYSAGAWERNNYGAFRHLCYWTIMQADTIVTQTTTQARLLTERFSRTSQTIRNPIDLCTSLPESSREERQHVLWIGKSDSIKRPEVAVDLARKFPDVAFLLIVNCSNIERFEALQKNKPSNVEIVERISFDRIEECFAQALALLNTSAFEGFPNTFLQAGKYGVPILSLQVDPDSMLEQHQCGVCAKGEFHHLVGGLEQIVNDAPHWHRYSKNVRQYVRAYHDMGDKIRELDSLIRADHRVKV